jgi:hypothetical protein
MPPPLLKRLVLAGETMPAEFTLAAHDAAAPEREAT